METGAMPKQANRKARIEARIDEARAIHLTVEEQQRFVELILKPPALAPALKRAKKAHARLIRR
jgi:uncharacterized protein (DUF1778 family)